MQEQELKLHQRWFWTLHLQHQVISLVDMIQRLIHKTLAYLAYPLKTYEDQVHDGTTTLEAFNNFASVVIAPEGLEINFDWKPLANSSGVATNSTHINADGSVTNSSFNPEEVTVPEQMSSTHILDLIMILQIIQHLATNDVFLLRLQVKSSGAKDGTNQYLSVNANPFFPAVEWNT